MIESVTRVNSLELPDLEPYRTLKRPEEHFRKGFFVAEGNKVVLRLFESHLEILSVLMTEEWLKKCKLTLENRPEPVKVFIAEDKLIQTIIGFKYHQGIMAIAKVPPSYTISSSVESSNFPRLFVALDNLTNSENTGVILRNCAACGVDAILAGETTADPYLRRSVRNSMGTVFKLKIVRCFTLPEALQELKETYNFSIIAAHPREESISLSDVNFTKDICIVLGNEDNGVSNAVLDVCDTLMKIPMVNGVDSFNVGCASAIILYEAFLQRKHCKGYLG
ncbi:MAG: RNA methyltransferase [Chitinispirillaceae bacterium]|nr:RNA methyltransferase [Chitinispirillaceae bacterium]